MGNKEEMMRKRKYRMDNPYIYIHAVRLVTYLLILYLISSGQTEMRVLFLFMLALTLITTKQQKTSDSLIDDYKVMLEIKNEECSYLIERLIQEKVEFTENNDLLDKIIDRECMDMVLSDSMIVVIKEDKRKD